MKGTNKAINWNEKKVLFLIFLIAFTLRFIAVVNLPKFYQIPGADAAEYDNLAINLLSARGFTLDSVTTRPTSWRMPLYPLFLAMLYLVFGHNYFAVRVMQCIMGALLCVIIFYIAKTIFGRKTAFLSAITLVFYQPYIFYSFYGGPGFLLSENLVTPLLALFVLFLINKLFVNFSVKNNLTAGILIGLIVLTRPFFAIFPLFLFGLLLIYKKNYHSVLLLKGLSTFLLGFILVILPWTARNFIVHKAFIPFSTESGLAFYCGNNPLSKGSGLMGVYTLIPEPESKRLNQMSELEVDKLYQRLALEFLFNNYKKIPKLVLRKLLSGWDVFATNYGPDGSRERRYNIWYSTALMFGLVGMFRTIKSKRNLNTLLLLSLFLYFCVIIMIFAGEPRYHDSIEAYLLIFASVGFFAVYDRFRNKILSCLTIGGILSLNILFYLKSDLVLNWVSRLFLKANI